MKKNGMSEYQKGYLAAVKKAEAILRTVPWGLYVKQERAYERDSEIIEKLKESYEQQSK